MRSLLILLILRLLGAVALAEDDYFPLAIGEKWTMRVKTIGEGGGISGFFSSAIYGTTVRNGRTYFGTIEAYDWRWPARILSLSSLPNKYETYGRGIKFYRSTNDAIFVSLKAPTGVFEYMEIPRPLRVGTVWRQNEGFEVTVSKVLSKESVRVNGHRFANCYHLRKRASKYIAILHEQVNCYVRDTWLAPGVGEVKRIETQGDGRFALTEIRTLATVQRGK